MRFRFSVRAAMWLVLIVAPMMGTVRCYYNFGTEFAPGLQRHLFDERLIGMT